MVSYDANYHRLPQGIAMTKQPTAGIQPSILRWARETVGLSVPDVARKLKRPIVEIEAWETGAETPTYPQLEKLAYSIYKRPLAIFFLPAPPDETAPKREFRTLPEADMNSLASDTRLQIREAHAYQLALNEIFEGRNPAQALIWKVLRLTRERPIEDQAREIRKVLGIDIEQQARWSSDDVALKQWREAVEDVGVFVFKNAFKQKDISGFCLTHDQFPIIYLNNSTTKTRQIFSLLHELAHLLFHVNGLSKFDTGYIDALAGKSQATERFCNAIAAEVLIPADDFAQHSAGLPRDVESLSDEHFAGLAARYGVSREAVLRRLLDQGRVPQALYDEKARHWASQRKPGSGGDWYASRNVYLSQRFAQAVISQHYRDRISTEEASELLGIKAKNFPGVEQRILQGASA